MTSTIQINNSGTQANGNQYVCFAKIEVDEEGHRSIECVNLPGVLSDGETDEECVSNISEAFEEALLAYHEMGVDPPFTTSYNPTGCHVISIRFPKEG